MHRISSSATTSIDVAKEPLFVKFLILFYLSIKKLLARKFLRLYAWFSIAVFNIKK